jgi:hypothetical protein
MPLEWVDFFQLPNTAKPILRGHIWEKEKIAL